MTGPARPTAPRPLRRRGEEGETLIEVLVAVVLMGVAFVALLGGMGTAIIGAVAQQRLTGADSFVRSAAEKVVGDPYVSCATGYETPPPPAGYTVTVEVAYWDGVGAFGPACPTADTGVQKVTLTVHSTGPRPVGDAVLEVVKRESMLS
ncbi:prepilin-type N-terminal cleavage/methylation domain-containing protein [Streptomyces sp. NPDC059917]|uniref:type IV pilus modification PilV family protein n=1 Tax=Streptomyces sp. NPDC059917 TaxID=3347002 RepID=UPI0036561F10